MLVFFFAGPQLFGLTTMPSVGSSVYFPQIGSFPKLAFFFFSSFLPETVSRASTLFSPCNSFNNKNQNARSTVLAIKLSLCVDFIWFHLNLTLFCFFYPKMALKVNKILIKYWIILCVYFKHEWRFSPVFQWPINQLKWHGYHTLFSHVSVCAKQYITTAKISWLTFSFLKFRALILCDIIYFLPLSQQIYYWHQSL